MEYLIEDIIAGKEALEVLANQCWDEVDQSNKVLDFDPDWASYAQLNKQGMIRYYGAYGDDHKQEGFAIFLISPSLHCKGKFMATSDSVYLTKGYRAHGTEFINLIIEDLRSEGVHWFSLHLKAWLDSGKLAKQIGCTHYENVLQRSL